jgi:hypothetical protein
MFAEETFPRRTLPPRLLAAKVCKYATCVGVKDDADEYAGVFILFI